jgi:hypothetical protein
MPPDAAVKPTRQLAQLLAPQAQLERVPAPSSPPSMVVRSRFVLSNRADDLHLDRNGIEVDLNLPSDMLTISCQASTVLHDPRFYRESHGGTAGRGSLQDLNYQELPAWPSQV